MLMRKKKRRRKRKSQKDNTTKRTLKKVKMWNTSKKRRMGMRVKRKRDLQPLMQNLHLMSSLVSSRKKENRDRKKE